MARIVSPSTAFAPPYRNRSDRSPTYLAWVRQQPCIIQGTQGVHAHHVRLERASDGKLKSVNRIGVRVSDWQTVPLSPDLHQGHSYSLHAMNEAEWWRAHGIDGLVVAAILAETYHAGRRAILTPGEMQEIAILAQIDGK